MREREVGHRLCSWNKTETRYSNKTETRKCACGRDGKKKCARGRTDGHVNKDHGQVVIVGRACGVT